MNDPRFFDGLLGHWGTTPGLNFIYAHLNRVIRARDLNAIYVTGPGHGAAGLSLLGIALDAQRNAASSGDADIGTPGAHMRTLVITAREDLQIAREVRGLLSRDRKPADR